MKNFKILSLSLIVLFVSSCGLFMNTQKKTEKTLIGKWDFRFVKSASSGEVTAEYESLMKELLKDSYFNFGADKNYEIMLMSEKINGTWSISEDGKFVITDKAESQLEIIEISEKSLVLSTKTTDDIITMYLEKK